MNTIRTLAAAAVLISTSLGAHAAPTLEENGSAGEKATAKPVVAHTILGAAKEAQPPTCKSEKVAYVCQYQYAYDRWGNYVYRYVCF